MSHVVHFQLTEADRCKSSSRNGFGQIPSYQGFVCKVFYAEDLPFGINAIPIQNELLDTGDPGLEQWTEFGF
jgi:hypothetical protein